MTRKRIEENRVDPAIENTVVEMATERPAWRQGVVANQSKKQRHTISPSASAARVRAMKKRLKALGAQEGLVLPEAQVAELRKAKLDKGSTPFGS